VVLDGGGKIAWGRGDVGGDPLLVVLTQAVSDSHLAGLWQDGVSYIFAGEREIDLVAALETLNRELGMRRLLLEGGAANGASSEPGWSMSSAW
jgi:riboflavin biosynthesis pyrimidine reductase